jgi:mannose-6-phosphate isomerase
LGESQREASGENRPWGGFLVLEDAATHKVKRIWVDPGQRLSYQKHFRRAEHWIVLEGKARVTLDGKEILLGRGESVDVPLEAAHRIENIGNTRLTFIEVQRGDYFGEDDIVRLEDDYGRVA